MTPAFPTRRSSDLLAHGQRGGRSHVRLARHAGAVAASDAAPAAGGGRVPRAAPAAAAGARRVHGHGVRRGQRRRSEEHTSELQSLMRISYAVFCLKKKTTQTTTQKPIHTSN